MKIQATFRLFYKNRSIDKAVNINQCLDKTHAETKFNIWARKKYSNAKDIKLLTMKNLDVESKNLNEDSTVNKLKQIFGMG